MLLAQSTERIVKNVKKILFVCTGNICRSPMAEGLLRDLAKNRRDISVSSAGVGTNNGLPPSAHAVEVLRRKKIDISKIRSRSFTRQIADDADYIFAMTHSHVAQIAGRFPQALEKTFLMNEFLDGGCDIDDPYGQPIEAYQRASAAIEKALPSILEFLDKQNPLTTNMTNPTSTSSLRIAIGGDHGGYELKAKLDDFLKHKNFVISDFGSFDGTPVDYPDYADLVCRDLIAGRADFGILICKSGVGMSIAANRFPQIRAALVRNEDEARMTRRHNNANVLCLSANELTVSEAEKIVSAFLETQFDGGRHERRVEKMAHIGEGCCSATGSALANGDPEIFAVVQEEEKRQAENIELIASENFTSRAVMEAQGSCLTNKYAEGYPGRRWYGGCEFVDKAEQLAIDRAKQLFGGDHVNVQPHSGSQANMAVYFSVLQPGDKILTMDLAHGGHLTHGHKANFSGRFYAVSHYGVSQKDERIDYDALADHAKTFQPKMITAGASAYPRIIDFERMRWIADSVGAMLFVDMAHIAGLVAAGEHPTPVPFADFTTTTTHKSLRGPRGGLVITKEKYAKALDSQIFPGIQGGPLMHVIAAKAVCLHEALQPSFKTYARQIILNAQTLAAKLESHGYRIVSGGTDNHLMLVDLRPKKFNGKFAQETLDKAGITVNKNGIPFDTEPISKGGGIRVGTPAVTTRGMKETEMAQIADLIHEALTANEDAAKLDAVRAKVHALTARFPLP